MVGKLLRQVAVSNIVLGDDHDARRVLVEPVNDAGAAHAANAGEGIAAMVDQRVDERTGPVAGAGMDNETSRLGNDDDIFILVEDIERNILALRGRIFGLGQDDLVAVSGSHLLLGIGNRRPLQKDLPILDQRLDAAAGKFLANLRGQPGVEAAFGCLIGGQDFSIVICLFKGVAQDASSPTYF